TEVSKALLACRNCLPYCCTTTLSCLLMASAVDQSGKMSVVASGATTVSEASVPSATTGMPSSATNETSSASATRVATSSGNQACQESGWSLKNCSATVSPERRCSFMVRMAPLSSSGSNCKCSKKLMSSGYCSTNGVLTATLRRASRKSEEQSSPSPLTMVSQQASSKGSCSIFAKRYLAIRPAGCQ